MATRTWGFKRRPSRLTLDKNGISWIPALLGRETKKGMAVSKPCTWQGFFTLTVHSTVKFYKDNSHLHASHLILLSQLDFFHLTYTCTHRQASKLNTAGNSHLQRNLLNFYQHRGHINFHTWSQSHQDIPAADSLLVHVAHEHSQPLLHTVMGRVSGRWDSATAHPPPQQRSSTTAPPESWCLLCCFFWKENSWRYVRTGLLHSCHLQSKEAGGQLPQVGSDLSV